MVSIFYSILALSSSAPLTNKFSACRTLIPPHQARYLFPTTEVTIEPPSIDPREGKYDSEMYPGLDPSSFIVIVQGVGEAIFVPSGWYHFVENMDTHLDASTMLSHNLTISINHNWFNVFSVFEVFQFLLRDLTGVREEISHLRATKVDKEDDQNSKICKMNDDEWYVHCEVLLKANSSLGLLEFIGLISARVLMYMMYDKCTYEDQQLQWRHYLCPWYVSSDTNVLDEHDNRCLQLLLSSEIQREWMDLDGFDASWLSNFISSSQMPTSICMSSRMKNDIKFPINALKFSILVVRNLLNVILDEFPDLVTHIDANSRHRRGNDDDCCGNGDSNSRGVESQSQYCDVNNNDNDNNDNRYSCDCFKDAVLCLNNCILSHEDR